LKTIGLALALGVAAATASAQNVVGNGEFDADLSGWTQGGLSVQTWQALDWHGNPGSGSVRVANDFTVANVATGSSQCIVLSTPGTYELRGAIRFPSGQTETGSATVQVARYSNATCTNPPVLSTNGQIVQSTTTDTWVDTFNTSVSIPAGTQSVKVVLSVQKVQANGSLAALFDGIRFGLLGTMSQDVVVNGHFHTDLAGWAAGGLSTQTWNALDWQGDPASGSARVANDFTVANVATGSSQCILLSTPGAYELGGFIRFPSGQTETGTALVQAAMYSNPTCTNPPSSSTNAQIVPSATTDTWVDTSTSAVNVPVGTQSVKVILSVQKTQANGSLAALFDRVRFGPTGTTPVELTSFGVE
jgi:hypothetical protein